MFESKDTSSTEAYLARANKNSLLSELTSLVDIQTVALDKVLNGSDLEYQIRLITRWYSRTFYTPLTEVFKIPVEEILQAFYESRYEEMEPDDLESERQRLMLDDEGQRKLGSQDEQLEADLATEGQRIKEQFEKEQAKNGTQKQSDKLDRKLQKTKFSLPEVNLDSGLRLPKKLPNVNMTFNPEDL